MSIATQRATAIVLIVLGFAFGTLAIVIDVTGGPQWLHSITWVGGGLFAYGIVSLIRINRDAHKLD